MSEKFESTDKYQNNTEYHVSIKGSKSCNPKQFEASCSIHASLFKEMHRCFKNNQRG